MKYTWKEKLETAAVLLICGCIGGAISDTAIKVNGLIGFVAVSPLFYLVGQLFGPWLVNIRKRAWRREEEALFENFVPRSKRDDL